MMMMFSDLVGIAILKAHHENTFQDGVVDRCFIRYSAS